MAPSDDASRLSGITTQWTVLFHANHPEEDTYQSARQQILNRYTSAIRRYLFGALRREDVVEDVYQEFALKFVRGDFRSASQERGRFRDFLRTTLYRLVVDVQRRGKKAAVHVEEGTPEVAVEPNEMVEADREFLVGCRAALLARAWKLLEADEVETGRPLHTVLRLRTENPELKSPQMAERLTGMLNKPITPEWVRQKLLQARERFAEFLLTEVERDLDEPTRETLAEELIELGLYEYCKDALSKRK